MQQVEQETRETNKKKSELESYKINDDARFLDYRLTLLEQKLEKGINKLEQDQRINNEEILSTLRLLQQGQHATAESMAKIEQRIDNMDDKMVAIDQLKDAASKNRQKIKATNHRIDVIQKILFAIGTAAVSALFTAAIAVIQLILHHP